MNTTIARRSRQALVCALSITALGVVAAGCYHSGYSSGYYVGPVATVYGPAWYPATYGTVTYVDYPWWGDPPPPAPNDPKRKDSPTRRAIVEQVHSSFGSRGYRVLSNDADVDVAVYASMEPELNIAGYTHNYDWKNLPKLKDKTKFPKGTVIVDVLQPKTHLLLWRGQAVAPVSNDVDKYEKDLRGAVNRIVEKYPKSKAKHD
jgi:Domain of unknown function (DUF4136)